MAALEAIADAARVICGAVYRNDPGARICARAERFSAENPAADVCIVQPARIQSAAIMPYTRREIGRLAVAALPPLLWISRSPHVHAVSQTSKPNSVFGGVQIGAISYCFRQISYSPE